MDAQTLKTELAAASYREDGGERPGTYSHEGKEWVIASRGFRDVGGDVAPSRVELTLSGGRVASLRDAGRARKARSVRLDPAPLAPLYGQAPEARPLVRIQDARELPVTGLQAVGARGCGARRGEGARCPAGRRSWTATSPSTTASTCPACCARPGSTSGRARRGRAAAR